MKLIAVLAAALFAFPAMAATPYRMESVMLLQPDFILEERVPSAQSVADYISAVDKAAQSALAEDPGRPASGHLVLAVRPGRQSMVWLDFEPGLPEPVASKLRSAILAVPAFEARKGVVVFALKSSLWGAPSTDRHPSPLEWRDALKGRTEPMEVGDLVDKVWPDRAGD